MDVLESAREELEPEVTWTPTGSLPLVAACAWRACGPQWRHGGPARPPLQVAPAASGHTLMPVPASLTFRAGRVPISTSTTVALARIRGRSAARGRPADDAAAREPHGLHDGARLRAGSGRRDVRRRVPGGRARAIPSLDEDESYGLTRGRRRRSCCARRRSSARCADSRRCCSWCPATRDGFFVPAVEIQDRPRFQVARPADRCRPALRAGRRDQAAARRHGGRQAERPALPSERGPGLPRREPQVTRSCTSSDRTATTTRRTSCARSSSTRRSAAFASCRSSTCPATCTSWVVGYPELASGPGPVLDRARLRRVRSGVRSDARVHLQVHRHVHRRDGRRSSRIRTGTSAATRTTASSGRPIRRSRRS